MMWTVDTIVVVLAMSVAHGFQAEDELRFAFGTGRCFWHLAVHEVAIDQEPEKAQVVPVSLVLTGCDSVSTFAGHVKETSRAC